MSVLDNNKINKLHLEDCLVISTLLDAAGKKVEIKLDGGWLDDLAGTRFAGVSIKAESSFGIKCSVWDSSKKSWSKVGLDEFYFQGICEIQFSEDCLLLKGFTSEGPWGSMELDYPRVVVECVEA